ncbi:unnamed protein product [Timema podura]|uniref:Uncharacterized protein n=1 Tax=Timema podura TaxID=61482 RepID=A0ABN7NT20_TIMPD|nr:unnamed protein product [Timema podura]
MKGEWNHFVKITTCTPDRDLNLSLPVIGSPVYCDSDALDHAATEADVCIIDVGKEDLPADDERIGVWIPVGSIEGGFSQMVFHSPSMQTQSALVVTDQQGNLRIYRQEDETHPGDRDRGRRQHQAPPATHHQHTPSQSNTESNGLDHLDTEAGDTSY